MTGRVEWRCSAPAESVHFRTNTHSVGNMSCSRWTELQLIAFFKNWLQCLQAKTVLWMLLWSFTVECSHDCISDSPNIPTSVELPLSPFFSCLCFKSKHDLRLWCFCTNTGLFWFCFASGGMKEFDKTESVKENQYCQTDTLSVQRYYKKKPEPYSSEHLLCSVLQQVSCPPSCQTTSALLPLSTSLLAAGCEEEVISDCTQWPLS